MKNRHRSKDLVVLLSLLGATAYGTWLTMRTRLDLLGAWTDGHGEISDIGSSKVRYAVWDTPQSMPPALHGDGGESRPALSPDGRYLVFAVGERGLNADLYRAEMVDGVPLAPEPLPLVNTSADELAPAFGSDALYFASDRGGSEYGLDLWRVPYTEGGFGEPAPVGGGLNTIHDETDPFPVPGSDHLVFSSNRPRAARIDYDLYHARPDPEVEERFLLASLDTLNSPFDEREPAFSADTRTVYFASDRAGGMGGFDLYRSFQEEGAWLAPSPLEGINDPRTQRGPLPSLDGFTLYFDEANEDGARELRLARSLELFRVPGPPIGLREALILATLLILALLAWLARYWYGLEVLYKCFLVSVLVHLFLLWYFREVYPESAPVDVQGNDSVFRVRLAPAQSGTPSHERERAGELSAPRPTVQQLEASLDRAESDAPEVAQAAPSERSLSAPTREATLPEREAVELSEMRSEAAPAQVELAEREAAFERLAATAPALAIEAGARSDMPARSVAAPSERSAESQTSEALQANAPSVPASLPTDFVATRRATDQPSGPQRRELARPSTDGPPSAEVAVALPAESFEGTSAAAPAMNLPEAQAAEARRSDSSAAPSRTSVALPDPAATENARPSRPSLAQLTPTQRPRTNALPERSSSVERTQRTPSPEVDFRPVREQLDAPAQAEERPTFDATSSLAAAQPERYTPAARAPALPEPRRFQRQPETDRGPARPEERSVSAVEPVAPTAPPPDTTSERLAKTPYKNRFGDEKLRALEEFGGGVETERAVAAGLAYLASIQNRNGSWGDRNDYERTKYGDVRIGKSALSLLAFLGAGHRHDTESEHTAVVRRAMDYLLAEQSTRNGHFGGGSSYGHGIATYALAEAYALTKEPKLVRPLQRAIERILDTQVRAGDERMRGGWGYYFEDDHVWNGDRWPRISVTAWQVMALESARLGGLEVPDRTFVLAREFLIDAWDSRRGAFRYSHDPNRLRSGYPILPASTPAALFGLSLLGVDISQPELNEARRFVTRRQPDGYRYRGADRFVFDAVGNLYFWYYGSLALFRAGGDEWERWNASMKDTLLPAQEEDGSWEPLSTYADYAGDDDDERTYTTAMCVLTLEVYYRYFTPLLEVR